MIFHSSISFMLFLEDIFNYSNFPMKWLATNLPTGSALRLFFSAFNIASMKCSTIGIHSDIPNLRQRRNNFHTTSINSLSRKLHSQTLCWLPFNVPGRFHPIREPENIDLRRDCLRMTRSRLFVADRLCRIKVGFREFGPIMLQKEISRPHDMAKTFCAPKHWISYTRRPFHFFFSLSRHYHYHDDIECAMRERDKMKNEVRK